jgi:hypothetical protein
MFAFQSSERATQYYTIKTKIIFALLPIVTFFTTGRRTFPSFSGFMDSILIMTVLTSAPKAGQFEAL